MTWLLALLKAIPGISKIFGMLEKNMRYVSAEKRRKEKHESIDNHIDAALSGVRDDEAE